MLALTSKPKARELLDILAMPPKPQNCDCLKTQTTALTTQLSKSASKLEILLIPCLLMTAMPANFFRLMVQVCLLGRRLEEEAVGLMAGLRFITQHLPIRLVSAQQPLITNLMFVVTSVWAGLLKAQVRR